jgi:hypothetical protein
MVRRGSTVRVRQRALQKPSKTGLFPSDLFASFPVRLGGVRQQVAALIERGQQSGRFTADIPPLALTYMLESLLLGAIEAAADQAIDPDAGGRAATIATLRAASVPAARAARIAAQAARATQPVSAPERPRNFAEDE